MRRRVRSLRPAAVAAAVAAGLLAGCATARPDAEARHRIRYFQERLREHPRLDPAYVALGSAYLDLARVTHDPAPLAAARAAADAALAIQPSLEAYKLQAAAADFSHRFTEALAWGRKAAGAAPRDAGVTALLVEARLGLGETDEARRLLGPPGARPEKFHAAAARGQYLLAEGRWGDAEAAFGEAARRAAQARIPDLEAWAEAQAGGAALDAGRVRVAREHLERSARLAPGGVQLVVHRAELARAEGRPGEALALYDRLLRRRSDPELHRKAFLLARSLGREAEARRHFEAAERLDRRALDAGEIFSLENLARLYCDAGVHLDEARRLAEENFRHKRDRSARETLRCVQAAGGGEPATEEPSSSSREGRARERGRRRRSGYLPAALWAGGAQRFRNSRSADSE